jgi:SOS response regulatory protein OraA/RecX
MLIEERRKRSLDIRNSQHTEKEARKQLRRRGRERKKVKNVLTRFAFCEEVEEKVVQAFFQIRRKTVE